MTKAEAYVIQIAQAFVEIRAMSGKECDCGACATCDLQRAVADLIKHRKRLAWLRATGPRGKVRS